MSSTTSFAAVGDAIVTRRLLNSSDPGLNELIDHIRDADISFANLEVLLHDYDGYPLHTPIPLRAPPWVADELREAGFQILSVANNHVWDYSHGGMEATMEALDERDFPYAGLGDNLADARAPAYANTPNGRAGLVATCSTIAPNHLGCASEQREDMKGRPGLSPLRYDTRYVVPRNMLDELREVSEVLGLEHEKARRGRMGLAESDGENDDEFDFLTVDRPRKTVQFESGEEAGIRLEPYEDDVTEVLSQIEAANRQSNFVVASHHVHVGEDAAFNDQSVAPFVEEFARNCIDAGADVFVGHGPHCINGIEIYDGSPIFYSLGNFAVQYDYIERWPSQVYDIHNVPQDGGPTDLYDGDVLGNLMHSSMYFESFLPICDFASGDVEEIRLHPFEMGYDKPRPHRGTPTIPDDETATVILEDLKGLSEPYGTDIEINDGTGKVSL